MKKTIQLLSAAVLVTTLHSISWAQSSDREETLKATFPEPRVAEQSEYKTHVGIQLGYADPGTDYDGAAQIGVEVGFQPVIPFGLGLEFSNFTSQSTANAGDLERSKLLAKGTYNFGGPTVLRNAFVGAGLGPVFDSVGDSTLTRLGINLLAGIDFPLSENRFAANTMSLGATANYLIVTEDSPDNFLLNAQLKYWF